MDERQAFQTGTVTGIYRTHRFCFLMAQRFHSGPCRTTMTGTCPRLMPSGCCQRRQGNSRVPWVQRNRVRPRKMGLLNDLFRQRERMGMNRSGLQGSPQGEENVLKLFYGDDRMTRCHKNHRVWQVGEQNDMENTFKKAVSVYFIRTL